MARFVFTLPDVGEGIAEVELVAWHVTAGQAIAEDAPLVDVLTEKATVEIPSPRGGRVVSIMGGPGDKLRVGSQIMVLETDEAEAATAQAAPVTAPPARPLEEASPVGRSAGAARAEKPLASPSVRHRVKELGVPLASIPGSGPLGRVLHADVDAYVAAKAPSGLAREAPEGPDAIEEIRIIGLRRRIAERMAESKRRIPHYSYIEEIDVTALEALRAQLNAHNAAERPHLTVLAFLVQALVRAIPKVPDVNALFDDGQEILRRYATVHVGIAAQTAQGLMVPVIRHTETLDLWQVAAEIARLSRAVREGKASRAELSGSTITISSLGPLGGVAATPVINPPEVAIVGVNRIVERPVVRDGRIAIRRMMNLSSSFDHRIVDGWNAAEFIQEMKRFIEQPAMLFMK
ncbi:MAG: dihydrolipoamide acetyltransferase family protein [Acetobacteraceae bacterium]